MGLHYSLVSVHPFYPTNVNLPNYIANNLSMTELLTIFFGWCASYLIATYLAARASNPARLRTDLACIAWFIFSTIHIFFEGYFVFNHQSMPRQQDLIGQLWKEYACSDSRYLTSNSFVLCMEAVTALLWGPLSILEVYLIITDSTYRHPVQSLLSTGQMYGLVLYYMTHTFEFYYKDIAYSRPEFVYFWIYYFLVNFVWMIVPGACLYSSFRKTAQAFQAQRLEPKTPTTNGPYNEPAMKICACSFSH